MFTHNLAPIIHHKMLTIMQFTNMPLWSHIPIPITWNLASSLFCQIAPWWSIYLYSTMCLLLISERKTGGRDCFIFQRMAELPQSWPAARAGQWWMIVDLEQPINYSRKLLPRNPSWFGSESFLHPGIQAYSESESICHPKFQANSCLSIFDTLNSSSILVQVYLTHWIHPRL